MVAERESDAWRRVRLGDGSRVDIYEIFNPSRAMGRDKILPLSFFN